MQTLITRGERCSRYKLFPIICKPETLENLEFRARLIYNVYESVRCFMAGHVCTSCPCCGCKFKFSRTP